MIKSKKILITGAAGFIGRHLAKHLSSQNNHITGTYLKGEKTFHLDVAIQCDVSNLNEVKKLANNYFDHIFHLAAIADVGMSIQNPSFDFRVNIQGTFNMLESFRNNQIKSFNFFSTVSVLSKNNKLPLDEESSYGPTTPYAASKMSSEAYCRAYGSCFDIPIRIIRLFNVYGPGRKGLVINDFITKLINKPKELTVLGDGKQIRDFLFVDDAIKGIEIIAEKGENQNIYHLGSGIQLSILDLAKKVVNSMRLKQTDIKMTNKNYKGEFLIWYADISKLKKLGFSTKISLTDGLKKTINWMKHKNK